jgi:ABC-type sugar transport system permease subunit
MSKKEKTVKEKKVKKQKAVKPGRLARRDALVGLMFITPWIIGALIFLIVPMVQSFYYSLNNIRISPTGFRFNFVGQGNYTEILLKNAEFPTKLIDYVVSTVISVPVIVVFALMIAIMLNQKIKGKGIFRLIFFLPVIIVSGPILNMINQEGAGSITALDTQSITTAIEGFLPAALASPISDLFENMITILWYSGVQILIFLSSLQKIDPAMYEAAKIDGGSGWECFWKITLPTIKPMILLNLVYTVVFISNNDTNEIIGLIKDSMFSGIQEQGYGYASAMAWMYSVVELLLVGLFALAFMAKKDVYAKQVKKAKKQAKKEEREIKRIRRRSARNAARQAKIESKGN